MQLHLETDELNLLADLLLESPVDPSGPPIDDRLLEMVLARDLRFDSEELERLAALLGADEQRLKEGIARETNASHKAEIERKLVILERLLEKVDEACVMI